MKINVDIYICLTLGEAGTLAQLQVGQHQTKAESWQKLHVAWSTLQDELLIVLTTSTYLYDQMHRHIIDILYRKCKKQIIITSSL